MIGMRGEGKRRCRKHSESVVRYGVHGARNNKLLLQRGCQESSGPIESIGPVMANSIARIIAFQSTAVRFTTNQCWSDGLCDSFRLGGQTRSYYAAAFAASSSVPASPRHSRPVFATAA